MTLNLKNKFNEFCKSEKIYQIDKNIYKYSKQLRFAENVAKGIVEYVKNPTPANLIAQSVGTITEFYNKYHSVDYLTYSNGWIGGNSIYHNFPFDILEEVLDNFPYRTINFNRESIKIYEIPGGDVAANIGVGRIEDIYFRTSSNVEEQMNELIRLKFAQYKSNIISYKAVSSEYNTHIALVDEEYSTFNSDLAKYYVNYIKKYFELNLTRSLMLSGPPGTGKSSLAQDIVHLLKLRTFRVSADEHSYDAALLIFKMLKFEAVIIDDLDRGQCSPQLLRFLDEINKRAKLVIGSCNRKAKFDPAVIRPGRFDEIIKVNEMDAKVIKELLGEKLSNMFFDQVKHFPIGYLAELKKRTMVLPEDQWTQQVKELNERALDAIKDCSDISEEDGDTES